MKLFLIDTVSAHRITYVIQAEDRESAEAIIEDAKEFSQEWLGDRIVRSSVITHDEYLEIFKKDNKYLEEWTYEQMLSLINTVNYNDP